MVIMLLICLVLFLIAKLVIDESVFSNLGMLFSQAGIYTNDVTAYLQDPAFIQAAASISGIVVLGLTVMVVVGVMYTLIFTLTPYVLEKNKIYGVKAMSYSAHLMKGYKGTLFVLYLSYLGWYILTIVITAVVQAFLPIPLVIEILMSALSVYLFSAELQTSVAVLFEEINLENNNV